MPLSLLKNVNVSIDTDGALALVDRYHHGCAVFDVQASQRFELRLTALQDDPWPQHAGAYCFGIIDPKELSSISFREPTDEWDDDPSDISAARLAAHQIQRLGLLSTGRFVFSDIPFDDDARKRPIFSGSLQQGQSVILSYRAGKVGYRLSSHSVLTDVTSDLEDMLDIRSEWKGKGKGKSKGKNQNKGSSSNEEVQRFVPCVWVFAQSGRHENYTRCTVKLSLTIPTCCVEECASNKKMIAFWHDTYFLDCVIECGSEQFRAHRLVLCAASPVFKAAFTGPMREAREACFNMQNCTHPEAVKVMLEFMYKGYLPDTEVHTLTALLPLAVQYQLDELCFNAADMLIDKVSAETVREISCSLKQFKDHQKVTGAFAELLGLLKTNTDLLVHSLG